MSTNAGIVLLASNMAKKSSHFSGYQLGAVIHRGKRIISTGYNQSKSHPGVKQFESQSNLLRGLHAEMHATVGVDNLQSASLTVVRIRKDGSFGLAAPCRECRKFLAIRGINSVYFSTGNGQELKKLKLGEHQ